MDDRGYDIHMPHRSPTPRIDVRHVSAKGAVRRVGFHIHLGKLYGSQVTSKWWVTTVALTCRVNCWKSLVVEHLQKHLLPSRSLAAKAPEKWCCLEDTILFLLGFGNFSGAFAVKLREGSIREVSPKMAEKIAEIIHLPFICPDIYIYIFICAFEQWQQHPPVTFHNTR